MKLSDEALNELRDITILLASVFIIITLCIVSAIGADYLWTIFGRLGMSSPLAPWFAIMTMMIVDLVVVICISCRLLNKRWPWSV